MEAASVTSAALAVGIMVQQFLTPTQIFESHFAHLGMTIVAPKQARHEILSVSAYFPGNPLAIDASPSI